MASWGSGPKARWLWGREVRTCLVTTAGAARPWASQLVSQPVRASLQCDDGKNRRVVVGTQCGRPCSVLSTAVARGRCVVRAGDSSLAARLRSGSCEAAPGNQVPVTSGGVCARGRPHLVARPLRGLILNSRREEATCGTPLPLPL